MVPPHISGAFPLSASIIITLPRDRRVPGTLEYFDDAGTSRFRCVALGRSAGHATNPTRNPLRFRGHTPAGDYALTFCTALARPVVGIGSLWIGLDPVSGQALAAEQAGRTGLGIHGGRGDQILKVTHGCIRLFDRDMTALAKVLGKTRFTVSIVEAA